MRMRLVWVVIGLWVLSGGAPVRAAGVVGDGTPGSCTEAALNAVLENGGPVTFNCGGAPLTITVTQAKLITKETIIDGGGLITLSGGGQTHVLENDSPLLTLRNLTIANGYTTGNGGGVYSRWKANLTIENCTFTTNTSVNAVYDNDSGGGAVYLHSGLLTITSSRFINNRAENSSGGAVHILFGNAEITDTIFEDNHAGGYGGAFYNDGLLDGKGYIRFAGVTFGHNSGLGQGGAAFTWMYPYQPGSRITIEGSRFTGNTVAPDVAGDAFGGGLRHGNGALDILATTFDGNTAVSQGGAIWTGDGARITLTNTTLSGNAADDGAGSGLGGALMVAGGSVSLTNTTLANNRAGFMGGAIWGASGITVTNTLFAGSLAGNPWGQNIHCGGTYVNGGGNFQSPNGPDDRACTTGITLDDPLLDALADNGGPTPTHALLADSPAVDAGKTSACPPLDQRGRARPFDGDSDGKGVCDSGAVEYTGFDHPSADNAAPYRAAQFTDHARLTWNPVTWAASYEIQVDDHHDFSSPVYHETGLNAAILEKQTPPLPGGLYYWRVRAMAADGRPGAWSVTDTFVLMQP